MTDIPANTKTKAAVGSTIGWFSSQLESPGDHDWIRVSLAAGVTYDFFLSFLNTGSAAAGDSTISLRNANGVEVASDDDGGVGLNSLLSFAPATSGTYFVDVGEAADNSTGAYALYVTQASVTITNQQLSDDKDIYTGAAGERILGGAGADTITIGLGIHALGEQGNDTITGNGSNNHISGGLGDDTIDGGAGGDFLSGVFCDPRSFTFGRGTSFLPKLAHCSEHHELAASPCDMNAT